VILHKKNESNRPSAESLARNPRCRSRNNERSFLPARLLPCGAAPSVTLREEGVSKSVGLVSKSLPPFQTARRR
jgi:hypothetical protein